MYLRSLELQGFKSFPDKTELKFNKGITAVVGPNGSGKSNISDAIKWVLGEQSAKAMRGDKMTDVIFNGSDGKVKRKPSQFAQVTINLDNSDHSLDFDVDVVSVSRKIYRNSDSEYLINGNNVRLKDVSELFMDTGLGRDGYAIVGQEKITDIVKGKSNDRRELFEEAAGITKSRHKKQEAERELASAEDNLARLNDILGELESRIGPLKNQCEKAKKFRILDDEKRKLEVSVWTYKLDGYMKDIDEFDKKLALLNEQYSSLSSELELSEKEIDDNLLKSSEKSDEADRLKQQIHDTELSNSHAAADIAVCENDISYIEKNILQLNERIDESNSSKYYLEAELKKRREDLEKLGKKLSEEQKLINEKESDISGLIELSEKSDKSVTEANNVINGYYLKKSSLSFKLESAKNNISDIEEKIALSEDSCREIESNCRLSASELIKLRAEKEKADELKQENENRFGGINKLYESKRSKLEQASEEYSKTNLELKDVSNKIQILSDLENSMVGFAGSVKYVMTAVKQGRISGICGSVAQLISVQPEYSLAVETALGGALQNIIVEDENAAKRGIRLLKDNNAGRATFLPITSVIGSRLHDPKLEQENGFVSICCDLVDCDEKYKGIIRSLLGRICIAEDIDVASSIAKKYGYKFRIVTLDGQVINAGGSFTGGSSSRQTGILTRKNEISDLTRKQSKLSENLNIIAERREKLNNEVNKLAADSEGIREKLTEINNSCIKLEMEIKRVSEFDAQYREKLEEANVQTERLKNDLKNAHTDLNTAAKELTEIDKKIFESEAQFEQSQTEQNELRSKREQLTEELSALRIRTAETTKDIESCRASISQLTASIESSDSDTDKIRLNIEELKESVKAKKQEIEDIKKRVEGSVDEISRLNDMVRNAQKEHLRFSEAAAKLRSLQSNKINEKENLSKQITRAEERKESLNSEFDKLAAQLWDEYKLTRSDAAQTAETIDDSAAANKRLAELRSQIKGLGSVNLEAIDEYAEVSQRYEFMSAQINDVNSSRIELLKLINDLTENMKSEFMLSFEAINKNFGEIFTELFGGGKAELTLTDPNDVLECGIDISVQPPGKVITTMNSLSGGEKGLISIAIYFAILKNSPSPFCMLDEIEAAFDDVNVTRFAKYLHRLTDTTQFITITHRRGTMEEADVLYGVTMQDKGISKLLKMSVDETRQLKL